MVFGFLEGRGLGSFSGSVSGNWFWYLGCLGVGFWPGAARPVWRMLWQIVDIHLRERPLCDFGWSAQHGAIN